MAEGSLRGLRYLGNRPTLGMVGRSPQRRMVRRSLLERHRVVIDRRQQPDLAAKHLSQHPLHYHHVPQTEQVFLVNDNASISPDFGGSVRRSPS